MKPKFEFLAATIVIALLALFTLPANADVGTGNFGLTNFATAQTAFVGTAYGSNVVTVANDEQVDLWYRGTGSAAGTSVITVWLLPMSDTLGTITSTNSPIIRQFAAAGATTVLYRTNIPVAELGCAGALRVYAVSNGNASCNMSSQMLWVTKKRLP